MAQNQLSVRLITRHDTEANWIAKNPVLMAGEMAITDENGLIKIGDNTTPWSQLEYINDMASAAATHYEGIAQEGESDNDVITRVTADATLKADDICVVKRVIAGEKTSYTAYVYDGSVWKAMDGNYNAENVYFSDDFTVTSNIGAIVIPSNQSNTTIPATGKNIKEVLSSILAKREYPTATKPSVNVSMTSSTSVEVGTKVTPAYTATLNPGSYTYGPATGITATSWSVTDNASPANTSTTATGSFPEQTVADGVTYTITATATYGDGAIPKDNLGDAYPTAQIKGSTVSGTTAVSLKGYRNYYYGMLATSTAEAPITSDLIRSLTKGAQGGYNQKRTFSMDAGAVSGAKRAIIAYPASSVTSTRKGLTSVILPNSLNFDAVANGAYVQQANVDVKGANDYTAVPYIVWLYEPDSIDSTEIHNATLA